MPPLPAGAPWWAQYLVLAAPVVGLWLFSQAVGGLNKAIRKSDADGVPVSPRLRLVSSVLNFMAGNFDKTVEQKAIAAGTAAPRTADEVKP